MKARIINNIFWLIVALILFIVAFRCGRSCNKPKEHDPKIIVKYDTVYSHEIKDTIYAPQLTKIIPRTVEIIHQNDTLFLEQQQHIDTQFILRDYFAKAIYSDTQKIQYGKIIINDTITQNRIASRRLLTDLKIPIATTTITQPEKRHNQIYFGIDGMSDFKSNIYLGFSGMLRNKRDAIWEAGALYGNDKNIYFFGSRKFLITFKK